MIPDLNPGESAFVDWSESDYHADRECVSNSWLSVLLNDGPAIYQARRSGVVEGTSSSEMSFGSCAHLALLEPAEWRRRVFEPEPARPNGADGRRKAGSPERDSYDKWKRDIDEWSLDLAEVPDAIVLDDEERSRVLSCVESVRSHARGNVSELGAADILRAATGFEQTIIRRDEETGVLIRHRLDILSCLGSHRIIADLKTSADPMEGPFGRSIARYGYHRQAAMYVDALAAIEPDASIHFVVIAVRSKAPFEVCTYEIEGEELEQGRREYRRALDELARRREDEDWLAPCQRGINKIKMPRWAYDKDDQ